MNRYYSESTRTFDEIILTGMRTTISELYQDGFKALVTDIKRVINGVTYIQLAKYKLPITPIKYYLEEGIPENAIYYIEDDDSMYAAANIDGYLGEDEVIWDFFDIYVPGLDLHSYVSIDDTYTIYTLVSAKYGNSQIASNSEIKFFQKFASIIFQYVPTWSRKFYIQERLRDLDENEIRTGSRIISTRALNPSDIPEGPNVEDEEIQTVNEQNVNKSKRSTLSAYGELWEVLRTDITGELIDKFKPLFKKVLANDWYTETYYD